MRCRITFDIPHEPKTLEAQREIEQLVKRAVELNVPLYLGYKKVTYISNVEVEMCTPGGRPV